MRAQCDPRRRRWSGQRGSTEASVARSLTVRQHAPVGILDEQVEAI